MSRRIAAIVAAVMMLSLTIVPPASAELSTAGCVISVSFGMDAPYIGAGLTGPRFDFGGDGLCGVTLAGAVVQNTAISGSGRAVLWNCAATVATGFWTQSFDSFWAEGQFVLTGANGVWLLEVNGPGFAAVAELTTVDAVKFATCPVNPVQAFTLTGVMELQDP